MSFIRLRTKVIPALLIVIAAGGASCGPGPGEPVQGRIDLVAALSRAKVNAPAADYVLTQTAVLGGQSKHALFMHAPSSAEFQAVQLGTSAAVTFAVGLQDDVQDKPGDGVEFTVSVKLPDGSVSNVWSKYIDPRVDPASRGWQASEVSLGKFAGQTVQVILRTSSGPAGDNRFDWSLWGEPVVVVGAR
jgi:hypothetical protein